MNSNRHTEKVVTAYVNVFSWLWLDDTEKNHKKNYTTLKHKPQVESLNLGENYNKSSRSLLFYVSYADSTKANQISLHLLHYNCIN
jgi:hypothetical protein